MKKIIFLTLVAFLALPANAIEEIELEVKQEESFIEKIIMTPKTLKFEKGPVEDFTLRLLYQGDLNLNYSEQRENLSGTYPMLFEVSAKAAFKEEGGEIVVGALPSRDVRGLERQFSAYFTDIYYKKTYKPKHSFLLGASRTPIGIEGGMPSANVPFASRSQIANAYGNQRELGVRFMGDFGPLDYDLGGYSSTRQLQSLSEGADFTGWVNVKPFYNQEGSVFRNLKIGSGVNTGKRGGNYTVAGVGGSLEYKKWLVNFEMANANGSNGASYSGKETQGLYTTVGYSITPKLQLLGRYDVFDPDKTKPCDLKTQYTAGINYYVFGQRLRFTLNGTAEQNQAEAHNNKYGVAFMTQIQL